MSFDETVKEQYEGAGGRAYHETKRSIPDEAYPWVARFRAKKIAPYVSCDSSVLEYGVGTGWNLAELDCGKKLGFDVAEHLGPVIAEHGIEFVADTKTLADGSLDVVICHHALEHVPNPPAVIEEMVRLLRAGGKLLLFVPFEKERRYRSYDPTEPNRHLYSWNVQTLGNLTEQVGLKVEKAGVERFGYDRFAAVHAVRFGLGERGDRLIRAMVHVIAFMLEVRVVAVKQETE